jgi:hypothetical protein
MRSGLSRDTGSLGGYCITRADWRFPAGTFAVSETVRVRIFVRQ